MYKVTEKDLIGDLKDFPIEVVQKMLERQVEQGNEEDVQVFQIMAMGGFDWSTSEEGLTFWKEVIRQKNFDLFFKKYPRVDTHVYYRGVPDRGDEIIDELKKSGGKEDFYCEGRSTCRFYFIRPLTKSIEFCSDDDECAELLRDTYTEKFLPEKKELIEIDGKRYRKEDVINRIKELKEEK